MDAYDRLIEMLDGKVDTKKNTIWSDMALSVIGSGETLTKITDLVIRKYKSKAEEMLAKNNNSPKKTIHAIRNAIYQSIMENPDMFVLTKGEKFQDDKFSARNNYEHKQDKISI